VYRAYKDGLAGTSPRKKGPPQKISSFEMVVTHAEVCQVGDGKLREGLETIDRCVKCRDSTCQLIQGGISVAQGQERFP
jgi:hypothetical protein